RGRSQLHVQHRLETQGQSWVLGDVLACKDHARHEADVVVTVSADGEGLAVCAEDALLVGHQTTQAYGVQSNACRSVATTRPRIALVLRGVGGPLTRGRCH